MHFIAHSVEKYSSWSEEPFFPALECAALQILFTRRIIGRDNSGAARLRNYFVFTAPAWALKLASSDSGNRLREPQWLKQGNDGCMGLGPMARIWTFSALVYLLNDEQKKRRKYHVADESFRWCHQSIKASKQTNPTENRGCAATPVKRAH